MKSSLPTSFKRKPDAENGTIHNSFYPCVAQIKLFQPMYLKKKQKKKRCNRWHINLIPFMRWVKVLFNSVKWWSHLHKIVAIVRKVYFHQLIKTLCCMFQLRAEHQNSQNRYLAVYRPIRIKNWGWLEKRVFRQAIEPYCFHLDNHVNKLCFTTEKSNILTSRCFCKNRSFCWRLPDITQGILLVCSQKKDFLDCKKQNKTAF